MENFLLLLLLIQLLNKMLITDAFTKPCDASVETVKRIDMCPSSKMSYEIAVKKKNCLSLSRNAQICDSFEYHCVLSDDREHAIEVCAPSINIVGHVCAKFDTKLKGIIRIDDFECKECPYSYNSTQAFQYTHCYDNITSSFPTGIQQSPDTTVVSKGKDKAVSETTEETQRLIFVLKILVALFAMLFIVTLFLFLIYYVRNKCFMKNKLYRNDAGVKFAKLSVYLAKRFPREKLQLLKLAIISTKKVKDEASIETATSAEDCMQVLVRENIFTHNDVIFMQFLCRETDCTELDTKCQEYAEKHNALCFYKQPEDDELGYVQFHVQADLEKYTKKKVDCIVMTVADMLACSKENIKVVSIQPSESFIIVLSIKKELIRKLIISLEKNETLHNQLTALSIDYLMVDDKTIYLKSISRSKGYTILCTLGLLMGLSTMITGFLDTAAFIFSKIAQGSDSSNRAHLYLSDSEFLKHVLVEFFQEFFLGGSVVLTISLLAFVIFLIIFRRSKLKKLNDNNDKPGESSDVLCISLANKDDEREYSCEKKPFGGTI